MAEEEQKETYTYLIKFGVATHFINSDVEEEDTLENYGYSDQEWDELSEREQEQLISEWTEEFVWNNIDSWGDVIREV